MVRTLVEKNVEHLSLLGRKFVKYENSTQRVNILIKNWVKCLGYLEQTSA